MPNNDLAQTIASAVIAASNPAKAQAMMRFFKTGPGQYGEGDQFLGLTAPIMRQLAKRYRDCPPEEACRLLASPWHEVRSCALLLLVNSYAAAGDDDARRERIYRLYLQHTARINNWDLVDISAPGIVGEHLLTRDRTPLSALAASAWLWDQRIAMIATLTFIRAGEFADTLRLVEQLLSHQHDLMHKAMGWMLREVGKRDRDTLSAFLRKHQHALPRTTLRYAIEHYPAPERQRFLQGRH